jgi:acyl dehydratase
MRLSFLAPVFAGNTVASRVQIVGMHLDADGATEITFQLTITNQHGAEVLTGEGTGDVLSHLREQ